MASSSELASASSAGAGSGAGVDEPKPKREKAEAAGAGDTGVSAFSGVSAPSSSTAAASSSGSSFTGVAPARLNVELMILSHSVLAVFFLCSVSSLSSAADARSSASSSLSFVTSWISCSASSLSVSSSMRMDALTVSSFSPCASISPMRIARVSCLSLRRSSLANTAASSDPMARRWHICAHCAAESFSLMAAVSSPSRARMRARAACPLVTSSDTLFLRLSTSSLRFSPPAGSRGVMRVPSFFLSSQSSVSASALTASSSSASSADFFRCSSMSSSDTTTKSCLPRFIRRAASTCICPLTTINSVRNDSASSLSNWQPTVKAGPLAMTDFGDPVSLFSLSESGDPFFGG